jgi:hypothetical protein
LLGAAVIPACGSDSKNFSEVPNAGTGGSGVSGSAGMVGKGGSSGSSSGKGGSSGSAGKGGGGGKGGGAQGGETGAGATAGEDSMGGSPPAEGGAPGGGGAPGAAGAAGEGTGATGATGGVPTIDECVEDVLGEGCRALLDCATAACDLAPCVGEGYAEGDYSGGACESFINCPLECDCDQTCVNNMCTPETAGDCMTGLVPRYICIQAACPDEIAGCDLLSP